MVFALPVRIALRISEEKLVSLEFSIITGKCCCLVGDDGASRILTDFLGERRVGEELFGLVESLLERKFEKL